MSEFIRLPNLIVNLSLIQEIRFEPFAVVLHWQGGRTSFLERDDAREFGNELEKRYGLLTEPVARLWAGFRESLELFEETEKDAAN